MYVHDTIEVTRDGRTVWVDIVAEEEDMGNPLDDQDGSCHILTWSDYKLRDDKPEDFGIHQYDRRSWWVWEADRNGFERERYLANPDMIADYLRRQYGAEVMPLYLFDHSGISVSTSDASFRMADSAGWDWGLAGLAFMTGDEIREHISPWNRKVKPKGVPTRVMTRTEDDGRVVGTVEHQNEAGEWVPGTPDVPKRNYRITASDRKIARERIVGDVKLLNQYVTGDVWWVGVKLHEDDRHHEETCGGYYGVEWAQEAAREMGEDYITGMIEDERMKAALHHARLAGRFVRAVRIAGREDEKAGAIARIMERHDVLCGAVAPYHQSDVRNAFLEASAAS